MENRNYNMESTSAKKYYDYLTNLIGKENALALFGERELQKNTDGPFLSIVMRTQGRRPQALKEALLCLSAQTNTDFELLIMGHNLDDDGLNLVKESIEECPEWMKNKIRLVEVTGGTRTTPLNKGFIEAKGMYITIYDDDDLLFDNWVETFWDLYNKNPGTILHAYSVGQEWETVKTFIGKAVISASSFQNLYCRDFELMRQLSQNHCPVMSLAFPAFAFKEFGIHFNEDLTTTEDWDFLMRTAFVCGVSNSENVTSIYRKWINETNSQVLHNKDEWKKNYNFIQNQFFEHYYPFKLDSLGDYICNASADSPIMPSNFERVEVFIDSGLGFENNKTADLRFSYSNNRWNATAHDLEGYGEISKIRFDPDDFGILSIDDFELNIYDENGNPVEYKTEFLRSNYVKCKNSYVFISIDPQIIFKLKKPVKCSYAELSFNMSKTMKAKKIIVSVAKFTVSHIFRSTCRWIYHRLSNIIRRFI